MFKENLHLTTNNQTLSYFSEILPAIELSPTIFGIILIIVIGRIIVIAFLIVLYCCNSAIRTMVQVYLCCHSHKKNQNIDSSQIEEPLNKTIETNIDTSEDGVSICSLLQTTSFPQK